MDKNFLYIIDVWGRTNLKQSLLAKINHIITGTSLIEIRVLCIAEEQVKLRQYHNLNNVYFQVKELVTNKQLEFISEG